MLTSRRVAIFDRQPVVRYAMAMALAAREDLPVVYSGDSWPALLAALRDPGADTVIVDPGFRLPRGIDHPLDDLRAVAPDASVVVFAAIDGMDDALRMLALGANAYVCKTESVETLLDACVHSRVGVAPLFSPEAGALANQAARQLRHRNTGLTVREAQVVGMYAHGKSLSSIAHELGLSCTTVSAHKTSAMRRLGIRANVDLILYGRRMAKRHHDVD